MGLGEVHAIPSLKVNCNRHYKVSLEHQELPPRVCFRSPWLGTSRHGLIKLFRSSQTRSRWPDVPDTARLADLVSALTNDPVQPPLNIGYWTWLPRSQTGWEDISHSDEDNHRTLSRGRVVVATPRLDCVAFGTHPSATARPAFTHRL